MRRAAVVVLALALAGCLSPGETPYVKLDFSSPTLVSIAPAMGGDAGVPILSPAQFIVITFSEPMDLDSLRPGIVIRNKDRREQPLTIQVDPSQIRPVGSGLMDVEPEFSVNISSAETSGFATGGYQLILRTLLIDQQGNSLNSEFLGAFYVQF